jgi:hypothetical protein
MAMATKDSPQQRPPPSLIIEFVAAFMRALNAGRLYTTGHELYKKSIQSLLNRFREALQAQPSLFLGCAKDALFLDGTFHQSRDTHLNSFLNFFHSLGVSHILLDKDISIEELDSFIALLAGAQQNQNNDLGNALRQENIQHVNLGLLDYSIFSTAQAIAARFAQGSDDQAFWQRLLIQPAAAGAITLPPEKVNALARLSEDGEGLKQALTQIDRDVRENYPGISAAQRGMLISNFLVNLEKTMGETSPDKGALFARQVGIVLSSFEPELRIHVLGTIPPGSPGDADQGVIHRIVHVMSDKETVYTLLDALQACGVRSSCFNHLFERAVDKYREPGVLLARVRAEMQLATQERRPGSLQGWQHLEQLILERQEIEEINARYSENIKALAQSIPIDHRLREKDEWDRLTSTLSPDSVRIAKTRLIFDIIRNHPPDDHQELHAEPLLKALRDIVALWSKEGKFKAVGSVLRHVFLILQTFPKVAGIRKIPLSWFSKEEIHALLKGLLDQCKTYDSKETASMSAICQIFPDKTAGFLIDRLLGLETERSPQALWLSTALAGMGPDLVRPLSQRIRGAEEKALPRLIALAETSMEKQLAPALEGLLDHKDHQVRTLTISALAHLKAESAVPHLKQIVQEKSWLGSKKLKSLQVHAAKALAEIGTPKAKAVLQETAQAGSGEIQKLCQQLL